MIYSLFWFSGAVAAMALVIAGVDWLVGKALTGVLAPPLSPLEALMLLPPEGDE